MQINIKFEQYTIFITLSNKPRRAFSKEHQTGAHWFDALLRAKVALPLSFTHAIISIWVVIFITKKIKYVGYTTKLMLSDGKCSNLGQIII